MYSHVPPLKEKAFFSELWTLVVAMRRSTRGHQPYSPCGV